MPISQDFEHLLIKPDASRYNNLEVESIIQEVCMKDREIQYARKIQHIETRRLSQDEQSAANQEKINVFHRKLGVFLDAGAVLSAGGMAVFANQAPIANVFHLAENMLSGASKSKEKRDNADTTKYDHIYTRIGSTVNEYSQQIQGAEREHDQLSTMIDRLVQTIQRTFELLANTPG